MGCSGPAKVDNSSENKNDQDKNIDNEIKMINEIINNDHENKSKHSYSEYSKAALIRIKKELNDFNKDPPENFYLIQKNETEIYDLEAGFIGPKDSLYQGGLFRLHILYPIDYPFKPPRCIFLTKVYHLNICIITGRIYIDILQDQWSPALSIGKILLSISSLLTDPNFDNPLDYKVANLYKTDICKYEYTVREWTKKHAI